MKNNAKLWTATVVGCPRAECSAVGGVAEKTPEKPAIAPAAKPGAAEMGAAEILSG